MEKISLLDLVKNFKRDQQYKAVANIYDLKRVLGFAEDEFRSSNNINFFKLESYWIAVHYSNGLHGHKIYFLESDPVCISIANPNDMEWFLWVSYESYENTKKYIESLLIKKPDAIFIMNDKDTFNSEYTLKESEFVPHLHKLTQHSFENEKHTIKIFGID